MDNPWWNDLGSCSDNSRLLHAMNCCYHGDPSVSPSTATWFIAVLRSWPAAHHLLPTKGAVCCFGIFWSSSAAASSQHALEPCPFLRQCKCTKSSFRLQFGGLHTYSFNSVISNSNLNGFQPHHSGESIATRSSQSLRMRGRHARGIGYSPSLSGFSIFMLRLIGAIQPAGALSLRITGTLRPDGALF